MEITLRPPTVQRIRAALGNDVDVSPAMVPTVLARLAVEAPSVYSQVLAEISGTDVQLDSERELLRRGRRGAVRRALFGWGEYESEVGDRLIAKRYVAAAVPLGMAALILVFLAISGAVGHRHPALTHRPVALRTTPSLRARTVFRPRPAGAVRHARPDPASLRSDLLVSGDPGMPPVPPWPSPRSMPSAAPTSWDALPSRGGPLLNPIVFSRQPSLVRAGGSGVSGTDVAPVSPVVYDSAGGGARGPEPGAGAASADAPPRQRVIAGQRVPARLATGVIVVAGAPSVPVVAESPDLPLTWLGQAVLDSDGRVQMTFVPASREGSPGVRGVALAPDRLVPGLAGRTAVRHPHAAGALVTAAVQATADYIQALARRGQVTLVDGWAQLAEGSPGPAWTYLAERLAHGIDLRGTASGPVETTEIDPGASLVILVTEAP
jgi:hypothetical protein